MELDRQKRDAIERYKQQELETQRAQVTSWQSEVAAKGLNKRLGCIAWAAGMQHLKLEHTPWLYR